MSTWSGFIGLLDLVKDYDFLKEPIWTDRGVCTHVRKQIEFPQAGTECLHNVAQRKEGEQFS